VLAERTVRNIQFSMREYAGINNTSDKASARRRAEMQPGWNCDPAYLVLSHKAEIMSSTALDLRVGN
jgi:hypothetical protein